LAVEPGSFDEHFLNLADHFALAPGADVDYWTVRVLRQTALSPTDPALFINGTWLGVAAADLDWTGAVPFRLEACSVTGMQSSCVSSNEFQVSVMGGASPGPSPVPVALRPTVATSGSTADSTFSLVFSPQAPPLEPPRWFLDGTYAGEGTSIHLGTLQPGEHRLLALYSTSQGSGVVFHDFESSSLPPSSSPVNPMWVGAGVLLLLGAAIPARSRGFLLAALVSAVHPGLRKDALLDHFNRGELHQVIKENPGIHFSELRRRVGISHGTAIFHLRALERAGIVRVERVGAYTTYSITGQVLDRESYGLTDTDRAVLLIVRETPGISLPDLATRSGRSLGRISRVVKRLVALGFVRTELSRRRRHVFPREDQPAPKSAIDERGATP
jgi:DNA-binding MarR family transcriptional regulator